VGRLLVAQAAPPDPSLGRVAVAAAGTSDLPVAHEAVGTLRAFGVEVDLVVDVGVAGLHRVLSTSPLLRAADVCIVVAGMEGALPSVVGGLVACPIVAVPTSVGYGAAFDGLAALLGMLNACAPGISVVNIDNGFGAAVVARRILAVGRRG
jgi:pyridinium-3,5-biscarboxylic acid mononucleotide synthase